MLDNNEIYNLLKIICDVIMISIIKSLVLGTKEVKENTRKLFLLVTTLLIVLNIMGIYRNSYTLWEFKDFMSYFWLGSDIFQLIFCTVMYMIVFLRERLNKFWKQVIVCSALFFMFLNIYNFLVNFKWYPYEPFNVFVFWFINNGLMIIFSAFIIYFICSTRLRLTRPSR